MEKSKEKYKRINKTETNSLMMARWKDVGELGEKGEAIKKYGLEKQTSYRGLKYITGNIVNNILMTMMVPGEC